MNADILKQEPAYNMYSRWAQIIRADILPRYAFVGGWLVGRLTGHAHTAIHFLEFDAAQKYAREHVYPVVWWKNWAALGYYKKAVADKWFLYDPAYQKWLRLEFAKSPDWAAQISLHLVGGKRSFSLLPPENSRLQVKPDDIDNYTEIARLIARLDYRISLTDW